MVGSLILLRTNLTRRCFHLGYFVSLHRTSTGPLSLVRSIPVSNKLPADSASSTLSFTRHNLPDNGFRRDFTRHRLLGAGSIRNIRNSIPETASVARFSDHEIEFVGWVKDCPAVQCSAVVNRLAGRLCWWWMMILEMKIWEKKLGKECYRKLHLILHRSFGENGHVFWWHIIGPCSPVMIDKVCKRQCSKTKYLWTFICFKEIN